MSCFHAKLNELSQSSAVAASALLRQFERQNVLHFYHFGDTFDGIQIPMVFVSEIEAVTLTGSLQRVRAINEKHGVGDGVFLGESRQKRMSENRDCCRFKLRVQQFVWVGIDGSIQPILLVVESDHGLVNRNEIRSPT